MIPTQGLKQISLVTVRKEDTHGEQNIYDGSGSS